MLVSLRDRITKALGERARFHRAATEARTERVMRLSFRQFEEVHGIPQPVADEAFGPQNRILESNRKGRSVMADEGSFCRRFVLDFTQRVQATRGILFEKRDPTV